MFKLIAYNRLLTTLGKQSTYLIMLQQLYGFRIGELLKIRRKNLNSEGFLYVPGSKKSSGRIVYVPELLKEQFCNTLKENEKIFTISYNQYYRIISRLNMHKQVPPGKKNNKVTHAFRHLRIQANERLAEGDYQTQKTFSGHRSYKGLSFYLINPDKLLSNKVRSTQYP